MGLGGFSGLINGLITAAFGALSMLMSEPTAKSNVKRTCMFVLSITTLHILYITHYTCIQDHTGGCHQQKVSTELDEMSLLMLLL